MSTTPEIPRDDAIPQLRLLLDTEAITPVLQRSLGSGSAIAAAEIKYLRYKQGKSMLVRYEVTIDGSPQGVVALAEPEADLGARATKPRNLELTRKVDGRTPAETPLAYDQEHDVLVQWTPLDIELFPFLRGISRYTVLYRRKPVSRDTQPKTVVRMKICHG